MARLKTEALVWDFAESIKVDEEEDGFGKDVQDAVAVRNTSQCQLAYRRSTPYKIISESVEMTLPPSARPHATGYRSHKKQRRPAEVRYALCASTERAFALARAGTIKAHVI